MLTRGKIYVFDAPIAQRIERYPPEVETRVRVAVGVSQEDWQESLGTLPEGFFVVTKKG